MKGIPCQEVPDVKRAQGVKRSYRLRSKVLGLLLTRGVGFRVQGLGFRVLGLLLKWRIKQRIEWNLEYKVKWTLKFYED